LEWVDRLPTVDAKSKAGIAPPRWTVALARAARSFIDVVHFSAWKTERQCAADLVRFGKTLHDQAMVGGTDGNLSVRLDSDRIMITPSGVSKGEMKVREMAIVNMNGDKLSGCRNPSSELGMHMTIYALRPDVRAVVHAHPCTATAFASAGIPLNEAVCSEIVMTLRSIPLASYATPGSLDLSRALAPFIPDHDAILMANHGAVTYGKSLVQAYLNMELVEHFARIMLITKQLGCRQVLSASDVLQLEQARSRYQSREQIA
jgi:L-fuculose-phosphate aldolase